jgi:lipase chaperone LimK
MRTASRTRGSEAAPPADRWGRALAAGALLAGLAGGAHHLLSGSRAPAATPAVAAHVDVPRPSPARTRAIAVHAAVAASEAPETRPASLRGTAEDGALRVDDDGDLVVEPAVLRFFDYYLSAAGEESPAALRARIVAAIHRRVDGARAQGQAIALLDTYLGYREATRGLRAGGDDPGARLDELRLLRRRFFGAGVAEALFGQDERALAVAVERRRVLTDAALSPEARDRRIEALDGQLPDAVRQAHAAATRPLRERSEEDAMRADGASDEDVRAYRVATDGEDAADRLAELDRRRAEWQARVATFQAAQAVIAQSEPDEGARDAAVRQLLDASFTPLEQIRVSATRAP